MLAWCAFGYDEGVRCMLNRGDIAISDRPRLALPLVHHKHLNRFESLLIFELLTLFKFALFLQVFHQIYAFLLT